MLSTDQQTIANCCQQYVNDNLCPANWEQHQYDYVPGQQVLKKVHNPTKFEVTTTSPYIIEQAGVKWYAHYQLDTGLVKCLKMCNAVLCHEINSGCLLMLRVFHSTSRRQGI
eukprot:CCRYP_011450-RA/>CCRYP_011450-RA protein AED:0.22 eAED:-0.12 QI:0/-1/0/1/-1/0/1/0/111